MGARYGGKRKQPSADLAVIELATALNRYRSLEDQEVRWLDAALRRERQRNGPTRLRWTPMETARLKRLVTLGKSPRVIAASLKRSEGAVWSRIRRLRRQGKIAYYRPDWAKLCPDAEKLAAE